MWNFLDSGPNHRSKHTMKDDKRNKALLAIMLMGVKSTVRLHGKIMRERRDENEIELSKNEPEGMRLLP